MKRLLFLILVLSSLNCFSQINRTIWGLTLGSSTKMEVRSKLIQKDFNVYIDNDGSVFSAGQSIFFGGVEWAMVSFNFVDGILSEIIFSDPGVDSSGQRNNEKYDILKRNLNSKYMNNYNKEKSVYMHDNQTHSPFIVDYYTDKRSSIDLTIHGSMLMIRYIDNYLNKKVQMKGVDEL